MKNFLVVLLLCCFSISYGKTITDNNENSRVEFSQKYIFLDLYLGNKETILTEEVLIDAPNTKKRYLQIAVEMNFDFEINTEKLLLELDSSYG